MAGRIPQSFIDDLVARTDIVELIKRRVPALRKAGRDYQACCPFHDERTPSFTVSPDKQFYHCFGCGAHGTAISFLMEYERLGFRDAVEELAQMAGLEVPGDGRAGDHGPDPSPLLAILAEAASLYRRQLSDHPTAGRARDYLSQRGLTEEVLTRFDIGYAPPGWSFLLDRLGQRQTDRDGLHAAGLVVDQDGRRYDRFRDRIMFPIRDQRGRVIGFGGRAIGDEKPKYLNSPETPVFHKGRELYGLYEASQARDEFPLLVVEGYLDAIALAQFGLPRVVATLGTATTPDHLRRLLRNTSELVFCFDGDRAGREAAWKALQTALPHAGGQQPIRFLFLPDGEDPDTLIRGIGRDAFEQRLAGSQLLSDFLFQHLTSQVDLGTREGRARLDSLAKPLIERIPNGTFKQLLSEELANRVGLRSVRTAPAAPRRQRIRPTKTPTLTPTRLAIALILHQPDLADEARRMPDDWRTLENPGTALLARLLETLDRYPHSTMASLAERWRDTEDGQYLGRLCDPTLIEHIPSDGFAAELRGAIQLLNRQARELETQRLFDRGRPSQWSEADKERIRRGLLARD
ncbi:DNA primase [Thioalkalicoccus limnaeus]|uniref:DNA primase n=1 Tax=Thioalkalicoccus limnaeus TaxID=120681 RepID=A0ABV4B9U0_9GAMM